MATRILVPLRVEITGGEKFSEDFSYDAEAYDVISVPLDPEASDVEVEIEPSLADQIHLFGLKVDSYTEEVAGTPDVSFKVHDAGNPSIGVDSAMLLAGSGAVSTLGAVPDKVYLSNASTTVRKVVTIVVAREATP